VDCLIDLAGLSDLDGGLVRADFGTFCERALAPFGFKPQPHHRLMIRELQAVAEGKTPRLMLNMPPGSAKSMYGSVLFPAWALSRVPNLPLIGASNTDDLAKGFSRKLMGAIRDNAQSLGIYLSRDNQGEWETSNGGSYRAAGVGAAIAGKRAGGVVIDDPTRSRADADSERVRGTQWAWFTGDLRTRLKPNAWIVVIMTRWHEDDLGGRLTEYQPGLWRVVSLPAIAGPDDALGRAVGEWLWSDDPAYDYAGELKRVHAEFLQAGAMRDWSALYQQDPRPLEGLLFKVAKFAWAEAPAGKAVRAWDLAATEDVGSNNADWTAGVKMLKNDDNRFHVADVKRDRVGPDGMEKLIVETAIEDGKGVAISLPQDPGQAGKSQIVYLTRKLAGYNVVSSPETGDKATRAMPFASQVNVGGVTLSMGTWNKAYIEELRGFPAGAKDDQVDASSRGFNYLTAAPAPTRAVRLNIYGR
jgi:predicted phage terminase large subunit-like protein